MSITNATQYSVSTDTEAGTVTLTVPYLVGDTLVGTTSVIGAMASIPEGMGEDLTGLVVAMVEDLLNRVVTVFAEVYGMGENDAVEDTDGYLLAEFLGEVAAAISAADPESVRFDRPITETAPGDVITA